MAKNGKQVVQAQATPQQPNMSLSEYVTVLRNQIVLSYDGSKEIAIKNFDDITKKLVEQIQANQALQEKAKETEPLVTPDKESTKRK